MASVHRFINAKDATIQFADADPSQAVDIEYALTWAVLENPQRHSWTHVRHELWRFGQAPSDEKIRQLIARAAQFGVAVEVNSHYHPNALKMVRWCQEFNAKIAFGSNAHKLSEVGTIVRLGREIWPMRDHCRALVTGAGSGVGRGSSKRFASGLPVTVVAADIAPMNVALYRADEALLIPESRRMR